MKRSGQILFFLLTAVLFFYLILFDYPAMKKNLTPARDTADASSAQESYEADESAASAVQDGSQSAQAEAVDTDALRAQIPAAQAVLFTGSIRQSLFNNVYPALDDAGYTGTMLFTNGHLTGDYDQMATTDFLAMLDDGWSCAVGGISVDLSINDWQAALTQELDRIEERTSVRPSVYCFQAGEYQPAREKVLAAEGFTALYYAEADAQKVDTSASDLKRICLVSASDGERDLQDVLDNAWSYDSVAFYITVDSDTAATADEWSSLLSALQEDDRFSVVGQSDWLNSEQEYDSERADRVAAVLEAEAE